MVPFFFVDKYNCNNQYFLVVTIIFIKQDRIYTRRLFV